MEIVETLTRTALPIWHSFREVVLHTLIRGPGDWLLFTGVKDTGDHWKFVNSLSPVLLTPVINIQSRTPRIFEKFKTPPMEYSGAQWTLIHTKTW